MLAHELLRDKGILLLRPQGPIQAGDFESVAKLVDPYIEQTGGLRGVMIEAPSFPGWDSVAALVSHLQFVRDHHQAHHQNRGRIGQHSPLDRTANRQTFRQGRVSQLQPEQS